jgi:DNA-directed RNA polymerase subunit RPC12/RpoP
MAWFRNYYRCDLCGHRWTDEWSAKRDHDCPECGARHMSPHDSDNLTL